MSPRPDMSEIDYEHDTGGNWFVAVLVAIGSGLILALVLLLRLSGWLALGLCVALAAFAITMLDPVGM